MTTALSLASDHAYGHMMLGLVYTLTKRAAQGIAECERALALDQNLAQAHAGSETLRFTSVGRKKSRPMFLRPCASVRVIQLLPTGCFTRAMRSSTLAVTSRRSRGIGGRSRQAPAQTARARRIEGAPTGNAEVRLPPTASPPSRSRMAALRRFRPSMPETMPGFVVMKKSPIGGNTPPCLC